MKIAVISDLHCKHSYNDKSATSASTGLYSDAYDLPIGRHPIKALKQLIRDKKLNADLLLCPGDITDRADKQGLITGWQYLKDIRDILSKSSVSIPIICTIGNHDVSSREISIGDPFKNLKNIDENYPLPGFQLNNKFWTEGYSIFENAETMIVIVNSSFSHNNEINAGLSRIDATQLEKLKADLLTLDPLSKKFRVGLCHHHPIKHANKDYPDNDTIDRGDELLKIFSDLKFQILIHGHKHDPRLTVVNSLPIFCAGSFSSYMNITEIGAENTFHIIELEEGKLVGTITSWVHNRTEGWKYKNDAYFPCQTGFGFQGSVENLAKQCKMWVDLKEKGIGSYKDLVIDLPDLRYLTPAEQKELCYIVRNTYNVGFSPELPNVPDFIANLEI